MGDGLYLAERYAPDPGPPALAGFGGDPGPLGPGVALVWALRATDDATVLILLRADGKDRALDALRRAGFPVDRITEVEAILPAPGPGRRDP